MKDSASATERVGRYQLLEPIGGGPNGMVSRAKVFGVAGFERQFAVKRFAPELTVGTVAQSLSAAARSYGSLEHPRIARMSEFGVAQGQTFTAVEYVAGLDAFRLLQEAKLAGVAIPAGGALALVSQAARAVGYAHGRGLSHLGLSPTNVIVTVDGDVKVTDFGILAATMPQRPVESARLAHRIPYLAPEQLAGESTSAATDVFVLGVIAYELVTGQRAYRGDTPTAVAQAILAGPPAEPPLPRPIVRVLQRCLARSPFERFPDARALADALDAALRVAPVPGTRKDIGAQIKVTLDRYAQLNEGNLSGMVALPQVATGHQLDPHDLSTQPFSRPDTAKTDVSPVVPSAAQTMPEMPKPFSTVAGLAPPPIPVPPGVTAPPTTPPAPSPGAPKTMLGLSPAMKKGGIPSVIPPVIKPNGPARPAPPPPRGATPPPSPVVRQPQAEVLEPSGLLEVADLTPPPQEVPINPSARDRFGTQDSVPALPDTPSMPHIPTDSISSGSQSGRLPKPTPGQSFDTPTGELSTSAIDELNRRSVKNTSELESIDKPYELSIRPPAVDDPVDAFASEAKVAVADVAADNPRSTMLGVAPGPAPTSRPPPSTAPSGPAQPAATASAPQRPVAPPASKSKLPLIVAALVLVAGLGVAGWYALTQMGKDDKAVVATGRSDAGVAQTTKADAAVAAVTAKPDAALVATATVDAGTAPPADAGIGKWENPVDAALVAEAKPDAAVVATTKIDPGAEKPIATKPSAASDKLKITSKPSGARVFIDGADQGVTPLTLPGSADRHTMVLLLPGHDLYIGEVDGRGVFDIALKAVTPNGGHAGIKVLKCKQKERYYVYVDGAPTGQTCPTERIDTVVGPHVVEVYDIHTDSRRKWDINIKDERLSFRVRIDD